MTSELSHQIYHYRFPAVYGPTLNDARRHWTTMMRKKRLAAKSAQDALDGAERPPEPIEACHITIVFRKPSRRRYDFDNSLTSIKPHLDSMVRCGILLDDNTTVVKSLTLRAERGEAGFDVYITPI